MTGPAPPAGEGFSGRECRVIVAAGCARGH